MKLRHMKIAVLLVLFIMVSCGTEIRLGNSIIRRSFIAKDVKAAPGMAAWLDPGHLVFISSGHLFIYNVRTGKLSERPGKAGSAGAYYFLGRSEWGVAALSVADRKPRLFILRNGGSVTAGSLQMEKLPDQGISGNPRAAFALPIPGRFLLVYLSLKETSIGLEENGRLVLLDTSAGKTAGKVLYSSSRYLPGQWAECAPSALAGWTWAMPDNSGKFYPLIETEAPPVAPAFAKLEILDFVAGAVKEIGRLDYTACQVAVSPSSDGAGRGIQLVLASEHGLSYYDNGAIKTIGHMMGIYPSQNPSGGLIYVGGWIVSRKKGSVAGWGYPFKLISVAQDSAGFWSPDGRLLAVANKRGLYLYSGFPVKGSG